MGNTFYIGQGDSSPALVYRVPASVNLVGATALFSMRPITVPEAPEIELEPATIEANNELTYTFDGGQTEHAGVYFGRFQITYADDTIETFPNTGPITVKVIRGK